jgi:hypothetical protein
LDENKKKFNWGGKRVLSLIIDSSASQIKRVKKNKKVEHNLRKKYLAGIYLHFKPERFDDAEDYEKQWRTKYNKEKVKNLYQEKKK